MNHVVASEAVVAVVIVVEKNRKTGDYGNDNDKDKAELSSLPAQTKLMPLGEKTLSARLFPGRHELGMHLEF
jgi:hypothetical protein